MKYLYKSLFNINIVKYLINYYRNIKNNKIIIFFRVILKYLIYKEYRNLVKYTNDYKKKVILDNTILYQSFDGERMGDSPFAIFLELISDAEYASYTHIWVLNDIKNCKEEFKNLKNVKFVKLNSRKYFKFLATSKYLINNYTFPDCFIKNDNQIYLNTWHGTPLKFLGKDMDGTKGQYKNIQRNLLQTTHLVNSNKYTADIILDSYDIRGLYSGYLLDCGYPRVDLTIKCDRINLKTRLKINNYKKIILYAPTWRGELGKIKDNINEVINEFKIIRDTLSEEYLVLLRVHPCVTKIIKHYGLEENIIPDYIDTNELISIVDILVTDYSSIIFDFMITKKPILFYANDIDEYMKNKKYYLNLKDMPGKICSTFLELISSIRNIIQISSDYEEKYKKCLNNYCYNDDGNSTKKVIDMLFKGNLKNTYKVKNNKKNIIMYCGGFLNNGITTSAINLLNNIDYSKYNVVIIENGKRNVISDSNIYKVNKHVNIIFKSGRMNVTLREDMAKRKLYSKLNNIEDSNLLKSLYSREAKRLFGNIKFDICIDFSGYVKHWALFFAYGNYERKVIYQHNDMMAEYNKIINGKYKHRDNLNIIFKLYRYFDCIVSVSEEIRKINYKNIFPICPEIENKTFCVNNSINYERILNLKDKNIDYTNDIIRDYFNNYELKFLNIGRLSPEKDQEKLIRAFKRISLEYKKAYLYLLGEGHLREYLNQIIVDLQLEDRVFFLGQVENPFPIIKECNCIISSSVHEGQPMVLLEALVLKKNIIATNIEGNKSVLKDRYGFLVDNSQYGLYLGMKKYIVEGLNNNEFNYIEYNKNSMNMFYKNVCKENSYLKVGEI